MALHRLNGSNTQIHNHCKRTRNIRLFTRCVIATLLASLPSFAAQTQSYPSKPVRFIIPFPPGGPTDIMGRLAADTLSKSFGVQLIADKVVAVTD